MRVHHGLVDHHREIVNFEHFIDFRLQKHEDLGNISLVALWLKVHDFIEGVKYAQQFLN